MIAREPNRKFREQRPNEPDRDYQGKKDSAWFSERYPTDAEIQFRKGTNWEEERHPYVCGIGEAIAVTHQIPMAIGHYRERSKITKQIETIDLNGEPIEDANTPYFPSKTQKTLRNLGRLTGVVGTAAVYWALSDSYPSILYIPATTTLLSLIGTVASKIDSGIVRRRRERESTARELEWFKGLSGNKGNGGTKK